ncbi:HD domain-containing protein [Endozoicomonadaceae bacterium StTr2]
MNKANLTQQLDFIIELDRLKTVLRQTHVKSAGNRQENSAEHSWHIAMTAMVLAEYASQPVDINHVIRLLLVHDIVEIEAGDTFCFDEAAVQDQGDKEEVAARQLFGMLPEPQGAEMLALWHEYETLETFEARFAKAIDCVQPFLLNINNEGGSWRNHHVREEQVRRRQQYLAEVAPEVWELVEPMITAAAEKGWIKS